MMTIKIKEVETPGQIAAVARLAETVWHETYDPILPGGQTAYMLKQFQSVPAVTAQIRKQGYFYYLLVCDKEPAGYFALVPGQEQPDELLVSKIYIDAGYRGRGLMAAAFRFIRDRAKSLGIRRIWLTVNKQNHHAQAVYAHYGFVRCRAVVNEIGNGYVMDDYIYVYQPGDPIGRR